VSDIACRSRGARGSTAWCSCSSSRWHAAPWTARPSLLRHNFSTRNFALDHDLSAPPSPPPSSPASPRAAPAAGDTSSGRSTDTGARLLLCIYDHVCAHIQKSMHAHDYTRRLQDLVDECVLCISRTPELYNYACVGLLRV
jgi:hypothetical protein